MLVFCVFLSISAWAFRRSLFTNSWWFLYIGATDLYLLFPVNLQVVYNDRQSHQLCTLYVITTRSNHRDEWIKFIREGT